MKPVLISVIVPIYQVENYLKNCVDSILNQTYKNLEIILVDDGSLDNGPAICDDYAKKDFRVKVIHKPNGGLSSARNAGLDIAKGDYISLIDGDDFIAPNFYETLLNNAIKYDADIVQCDYLRIPESTIPTFSFPISDDSNVEITNNIGALNRLLSHDLSTYVGCVVVWDKIYKRNLFDNIRYPLAKMHEDEFTTYKVLYNCNKFVNIPQVLYAYVQRDASIMKKQFNRRRFDCLEAFDEALTFFDEHPITEIKLKFFTRYFETIVEYIYKANNSGSPDTEGMIHDLIERYYLLLPKFEAFKSKCSEFTDELSHLNDVFKEFETLKDSLS